MSQRKNMRWLYMLLFMMILMMTATACKKEAVPVPNQKESFAPAIGFQEFITEIFVDEVSSDAISLHYTIANPEKYGIVDPPKTLGNFSIKELAKNLKQQQDRIVQLQAYDYNALTKEEQLIYDALYHVFSKAMLTTDQLFYSEVLGPTTGFQAQLPILLAEYQFYQKEDVRTYLTILDSLPSYFQEIAVFEKEKSSKGLFMNQVTAERIIKQCEDFIGTPEENFLIEVFDEKLEQLSILTTDEKILLSEENRTMILTKLIPAYESLIASLNDLKETGVNQEGLCGLKDGDIYYEKLVQSKTGSSKSIKEMKATLSTALATNQAALTSLVQNHPSLFEEYHSLTFPYDVPEDIIEHLRISIQEDFPELSEVNYTIKYVPESLKEHLSPAMYLVPPIDHFTDNYIYINDNEEYDMSTLFPTIAHEGYPGHLYQNVYFRKTNPSPIRNIISALGYEEGWATYVELYSYDWAELSDALTQFLKANMVVMHCLYSLTDIGIHYEGWTKEQTMHYWMGLGTDTATAEEIYFTILSEPGIYLPYSIGYLELIELRNIAMNHLGTDFRIKDFHEFILNIGPVPFDVIEKYLLQWVEK